MIKTEKNTAALVLLIAKGIVQDQHIAEIEEILERQNINWERFKEHIVYHDIIPSAYASLKEYLAFLPEGLADFLKNNYYANILRFQYLEQEFFRISGSCRQEGVVFVPIKGMGLFDYYDNLSLRQMSDIDILIKEKDFSVVTELFYKLGYEKDLMGSSEEYWKKKQCAITFSKRKDKFNFLVDVHWALDFKRHNKRGLPNLWNRVREIEHGSAQMRLLSDEDAFFALALHNRRFGKTLCLKNACDIALILNKCNSKFDWDYILKEGKKSHFASTVFFVLYQAKFLFGLDIPKHVLKNLGVSSWKQKLIQSFIQRNSFLPYQNNKIRELYLKSHFLLYDSFYEPLGYIFNIPIEQFAKFYKLKQKGNFTRLCYYLRWLYMPLGYLKMKLMRNKELKDEHKTGLSR